MRIPISFYVKLLTDEQSDRQEIDHRSRDRPVNEVRMQRGKAKELL